MKTSYPKIDVGAAMAAASVVNKALGAGPFRRPELLHALGYAQSSGRGNEVVSSLVQYKIIHRQANGYYLTAIGAAALETLGQQVPVWGFVVEVFLQPQINRNLYETFGAKPSPAVVHQLIDVYGLTAPQAKIAMKQYYDSIRFIGEKNVTDTAAGTSRNAFTAVGWVQDVAQTAPSSSGLEPAAMVPSLRNRDGKSVAAVLNEEVDVDFGNGMKASIPKRLILRAYMDELTKMQCEADPASCIHRSTKATPVYMPEQLPGLASIYTPKGTFDRSIAAVGDFLLRHTNLYRIFRSTENSLGKMDASNV